MSVIGHVVERKAGQTIVRVERKGCASCARGCSEAVLVTLPPLTSDVVALELSARDRLLAMVNSLFLPLAGFIAGAIVANVVTASEVHIIAGSLVGLAAGVAACRIQPFHKLKIIEAYNDR